MKTRRILTMAAAAITLSAAVAIPAGAHFLAEDRSAAGTAATGTLVPVVLEALTGGAGETPNNALQPVAGNPTT